MAIWLKKKTHPRLPLFGALRLSSRIPQGPKNSFCWATGTPVAASMSDLKLLLSIFGMGLWRSCGISRIAPLVMEDLYIRYY